MFVTGCRMLLSCILFRYGELPYVECNNVFVPRDHESMITEERKAWHHLHI